MANQKQINLIINYAKCCPSTGVTFFLKNYASVA